MSKTEQDLKARMAGKLQQGRSRHAPPAARAPLATLAGGLRTEWLDIERIEDNPYQPAGRTNKRQLQKMIEDFRKDGQLQPGLVRPHPDPARAAAAWWQMAYGHRRKATVKAGCNAGLNMPDPELYTGKLRCEIREKISDLEMLRYAIHENDNRLDNDWIQRAQMYTSLRLLTTQEMQAEGHVFEAGELAGWRVVAERNGYGENKFSDMHRIADLLNLPQEMWQHFRPLPPDDPNAANQFILNGRHGRALLKFRHYPDDPVAQRNMKTLLRNILHERLNGSQAEARACKIRDANPDRLALNLNAAAKQQQAETAAKSRTTTRTANREALEQGKAHLSMVSGVSGQVADGGEQVAAEREPFTAPLAPDTRNLTPDEEDLLASAHAWLETLQRALAGYHVAARDRDYAIYRCEFLKRDIKAVEAEIKRLALEARELKK